MALLSVEQLAGPGYIILNVLRVVNIIALASVVASSIVMLVKTFIISKFFFFDATSHVVTGIVGLFLIVSECSLFRGYFSRNWPLLSPSHGFVSLGCAMMIIGLNMLGNMNKQATSQESLSMPFWRLLVAAGCLAIVIGFFNVVASFVFRDKSRRITARLVRSKGAISLHEYDIESHHTLTKDFGSIKSLHTGSPSSRTAVSPTLRIGTPTIDMGSPLHAGSPNKEGRLSQFNFSPMRTLRNARQSFLPSYHSTSPIKSVFQSHSRASSAYSRSTSGESKYKPWRKIRPESEVPDVPMNISAPMNVNPQFAHLVRPNMAHHPSLRRGEEREAEVEKFKESRFDFKF